MLFRTFVVIKFRFMRKLQMVDLKGQYEKIKDEVNTSLSDVLENTSFINGPAVQDFQKNLENYLEVKHVIPCANGTDALQIAMMGLGLEPGDEVITADFTFAATAEVIALLRLNPVLVDIEEDSFNIDPEAIKKAITPKTKAIVPIHLFGQASNMEAILQIAKENDLYVIEDNAQATGSNYAFRDGSVKKTGTLGDIGATSFFPSKNLGCYGDGGALTTNDDELAHKIRGIVNHGMYKRYYHDVIGVNSRLDSFQAAILNVKLPYLDNYNKARRKAAQQYTASFAENKQVSTPKIVSANENSHVFHQYALRVFGKKRDALFEYLQKNNIPCGIYYPVPLHRQKAYADNSYQEENFKISNRICKEVIALPMHTELEEEQINFITATINSFLA